MLKRSLHNMRPQSRRGFTLIELLAVMVVIGILVGLLMPAVMRGFVTVRNGNVSTDIAQLGSAIGKFRATYGMDPPSSIVIYEAGAGAWDATNAALIRQIWPLFDFATPFDLNQNGLMTDIIPLVGPECLVFFLGGPNVINTPLTSPKPSVTPNMGACIGFSKNPAYPFERTSTSRDKSVFEFQPGRFTDLNQNGFPEYLDPLPSQIAPYLYYSSYDGQGYDSSAALASAVANGATIAPADEFNYVALYFGGLSSSVYFQGLVPATPMPPAWNQNSVQIISAGYDHLYGLGGAYLTTGTTRLPGVGRNYESDNITNFSGGVLQP